MRRAHPIHQWTTSRSTMKETRLSPGREQTNQRHHDHHPRQSPRSHLQKAEQSQDVPRHNVRPKRSRLQQLRQQQTTLARQVNEKEVLRGRA